MFLPHVPATIFFAQASALALGADHGQIPRIMSTDEVDRMNRFVDPQAKRLFMLSRIILRKSLTCLFDLDPAYWTFTVDRKGKPMLAPQTSIECDVHFNLSHTAGLVAVGLSSSPIGIDVEQIDQALLLDNLKSALSAAELCVIDVTPNSKKLETFLQIWCMKESYLKACGTGVTVDLGGVSVVDDDLSSQKVMRKAVNAPAWTVKAWRPTDRHIGSVAIQGWWDSVGINVYEWVTLNRIEARPFVPPR